MAGEKWEENLPCPACNMRGCSYCGNTGRVGHTEYSDYDREKCLKLLLTEFIRRCNPLAYDNGFEVCAFCGGPKKLDRDHPDSWRPMHFQECLFTRAETAIDAGATSGN